MNRWISTLGAVILIAASAQGAERNEWYWNSPVNIHWDNHGRALGQGMTSEEIVAMFEGLKVDMIQVSARSGYTTYPSQVGVPNPTLSDYDTLATWRQITRRLGTRMWVYINIIEAPHLIEKHPDWRRVDARGQESRVCNRPSADGSGWLEQYMIPLVREIIERYEPDGFWFDGDWQIPDVCYCPHCRAAWKEATGRGEPPKDADDPNWPRWVRLEQQRRDEYKRKLAHAIHTADPDCCYVSNWSWAISHRDPRTAPSFADTLSGDVGGGSSRNALNGLRFASLILSAQEHTPHDVMSAVYPKKVRTLPRMLQEGGLVMSSGSSWFLWVNQLTPEQFAHLRSCYGLVDSRREALGRTHSLNPVAVLLSETTWEHGLASSGGNYFDHNSPRDWAFAFQDAWYGIDVVNEQTLREQIGRWRVIVVANQRRLGEQTLDALRQFVERGGTLVVTDGALRTGSEEDDKHIVDLLGIARKPQAETPRQGLVIGEQTVPVRVVWQVEPRDAEVVATLTGAETPVLTVQRHGRGQVAYLALSGLAYPDVDGLVTWLMDKLGLGPMLSVIGDARDNHLVFSLRRCAEDTVVLHVADLTTYANGRRIEPNSSHEIDPIRTIPIVKLQLPMATTPTSVRAVPAETGVDWEHADGSLHLVLRNVQTHAAVLLEGSDAKPQSLLPRTVEPAPPRRYEVSPVMLDEDFDDTPLDRFPEKPIWSANADDKTAIRVTRDPSSPDNHVLEFVDAPDARKSFVPYLVVAPRQLDRGRAKFSCRLRLEPGAQVNLELRDTSRGSLSAGPSIRITEEGKVLVAGKKLTEVPVRQWFRLTLEFGLGFEGPEYRLTVHCPDRPAEHFDGLPYVSSEFTRCTWLGIVSYATAETRFHADDVKLERVP